MSCLQQWPNAKLLRDVIVHFTGTRQKTDLSEYHRCVLGGFKSKIKYQTLICIYFIAKMRSLLDPLLYLYLASSTLSRKLNAVPKDTSCGYNEVGANGCN